MTVDDSFAWFAVFFTALALAGCSVDTDSSVTAGGDTVEGAADAVESTGTAIVENRSQPGSLQISGGYVYWAQPDGIYRVGLSGGSAEPVQVPSGTIQTFVVTQDSVYWVTTEDGASRIRGELLAGGPTLINSSDPHPIDAISAGPLGVFWGASGPVDGVMWRFTDLSTVQHAQSAAVSIATDESHVFWSDGRFIWRSAPDGSEAERLSSGQSGADSIRLSATHVFWVTESGDIFRIKKTGGSDQAISTSEVVGPRGTAFFDDALYVAHRGTPDGGSPGIGRVVVGGTGFEPLIELPERPPGLSIDAATGTVIWSDFQAGAIRSALIE